MPPAAQKHALLIGNDRYQDLPDLKVPAADVAGLARVLTDPAIGGFDPALVNTLANPDYAVAHRAIGRLFANRQRDDLVLLYFSGHGALDHRTGRLYLALPDSERDCLDGTALAAPFITDVMDRSSAGRQILILDCCYAGAIGRKSAVVTAATFGADPAAAPAADAGYGRVILTSSTAGESSWEGNQVIAGVERSLFTHFLIQGLETGEAAAGAPVVSVEQLYQYVHARVVKATAAGTRRMTPERFGPVRGELILARNPQARAPAPDPKDLLGADLLADLASENHRTRIGAVGELVTLLHQAPLRPVVIAVLEERLPRERDFHALGLIKAALTSAAARAGGTPALPGEDAAQGLPDTLNKPAQADPPPVKPRRPGWLVPVVLGVAAVVAALAGVPGMVPKRTEPVVVAPVSPPPAAIAATPVPTAPVVAAATPASVVPVVAAAGTAPTAPLPTFTDTLKDGSAGPTMVRIPAGTFQMGSPESEPERESDEQQHSVTIKRPFAIGKYEVSCAEYDRFAEKTGRKPPDDTGWGRGNRPVINVSWDDATAYAAWLAEQTGRPYRLPTEAEWEYAARAGTPTPFWTGACIHTDQANYDGNSDYNGCGAKTGVYPQQTLPVDSLAANPWGLHHMAGNVWEWTCSDYAATYDGKEIVCISKNDANNGPIRAIRGGAWTNLPAWLRSANRDGGRPSTRNVNLGFRLAQDL